MSRFDWRIAAVAIITLAGLEAYALHQGINGAVFSLVVMMIAGIAGFKLRK